MERGRTRPRPHGVPSPVGALTQTAPGLRQASGKHCSGGGAGELDLPGQRKGKGVLGRGAEEAKAERCARS